MVTFLTTGLGLAFVLIGCATVTVAHTRGDTFRPVEKLVGVSLGLCIAVTGAAWVGFTFTGCAVG